MSSDSSVIIVTGESSGELYGALLAKEIMARKPGVRIYGVGGERMREAGVAVFSDIASALGAFEVLSSLKKIRLTFNKTVSMLKEVRPDVVVLIDYPDFNFRVAAEAKKLGIKVLYYVSPQIWAWRKGRIKTIAKIVDKMAVILPFEEGLYKKEGIPCEFVGHPILEEIEGFSEGASREALSIDRASSVLALLPGSRPNELKRHLPLMLEAVKASKKEFPDMNYILPLAPNLNYEDHAESLTKLEKEGVRIIRGNALQALSASDAAIVASGTASLQAAFLETPMVVIYKLSPMSYLIGRLIIDVKYITLVNLILGKRVVAEFLQSEATTANIISELKRLIADEGHREAMVGAFKEVKGFFSGKAPSKRVAEIVGEMAGWEA